MYSSAIQAGTLIGANTPQTPQKLTSVRHPTSKLMIIERMSYHERVFIQIDRAPKGIFSKFAMGFVDGHVIYESSSVMLDGRDPNWTGRLDPSSDIYEPGVLGRDVP